MIWADAWKKVRCGSTSPRILGYPPDVVRFPASGVKADQGLTNSTSALATPVLGQRKAPISGAFLERMMGLEPTTFCMASRRSSQLSYIRVGRQYSRRLRGRSGSPRP